MYKVIHGLIGFLFLLLGCIPVGNPLASGYVEGVISGGGGLGEVAAASGASLLLQLLFAIFGSIGSGA